MLDKIAVHLFAFLRFWKSYILNFNGGTPEGCCGGLSKVGATIYARHLYSHEPWLR